MRDQRALTKVRHRIIAPERTAILSEESPMLITMRVEGNDSNRAVEFLSQVAFRSICFE